MDIVFGAIVFLLVVIIITWFIDPEKLLYFIGVETDDMWRFTRDKK